MISSDVLRGYNDSIILSVLARGDSYGYAISKRIREITGERYVMKETTLYSAFNRLERSGYIRSYAGSETYGRPRTYFSITQAGSAYLREKCREWELTREIIGKFLEEDTRNGNHQKLCGADVPALPGGREAGPAEGGNPCQHAGEIPGAKGVRQQRA